jgi:hypothetical protein
MIFQSHEYFLYAGLMFIDIMGFAWIVQQYYVAKHNNETDGIIGNCTNTDNDEDDESHVSSKIKQKLTLTGEEECEYDYVNSGFTEEGKIKLNDDQLWH